MVVSMKLSEKYDVPSGLALLYDFVNSLDERRYVERGVAHTGGTRSRRRACWWHGCRRAAYCEGASRSTRATTAPRWNCEKPCATFLRISRSAELMRKRRPDSLPPQAGSFRLR